LCWSLGWSGVQLDEEEPDFIIIELEELLASRFIIKESEKTTRGGEWESIKIPLWNSTYVSSSNRKAKTLQENDEHTDQQYRNDPLKVMNTTEKEWDQLDTQLARYDQNSEQILLLKLLDGYVWPWTGYAQFRQIYPAIEPDMSGLPRNFLLNFDSWATGHQNGWNLDTRVTLIQVTSFQWGFSQIQIFSFQFWMNSKNLGFMRNGRNQPNRRGSSHRFISRLEVDDETQPSTQTHGRNRRKTPQIMRSRIGPKIVKNYENGKHYSTTKEMNQHKSMTILMQIKNYNWSMKVTDLPLSFDYWNEK
jgi:hypothetical protein